MTARELYDELGRQLGVTAETELVEATRQQAGPNIGRIFAQFLAAKTTDEMDSAGDALVIEGKRIRQVLALHLETEILAKSVAADAAKMKNAGFGQCPACGAIGDHVCPGRTDAQGFPLETDPAETHEEKLVRQLGAAIRWPEAERPE
jgi:RNA polymerase-binding transcription factor DksA